jgi:hypothetical protein
MKYTGFRHHIVPQRHVIRFHKSLWGYVREDLGLFLPLFSSHLRKALVYSPPISSIPSA